MAILISSIFGAAVVDTIFADVVPIRPYDLFFKWVPQFHSSTGTLGSAQVKGILLIGILLLFLAAFLPSIANLTTGITVAHTGFTPNPNVTASPGYVSMIRTLPLVGIGIGLGFALDDMGKML